MDKIYNSVVLAALLHDIGKFYQKGDCRYFSTSGKHPEVSVNFIKRFEKLFENTTDIQLLTELVEKHHEDARSFPDSMLVRNAGEKSRPFAQMISFADNISSKERGEESEDRQNYRTRPLASIFSSITLDDSIEIKPGCYKPGRFEPDNCFPDSEMMQNIVSKNSLFIEDFTNEIEILAEAQTDDFNALFTLLNTMLLKYLWCIPSSSQDRVPDVSLYDHLKTTSAIAACIYRYHEDKKDYVISHIKDRDDAIFKMVLGDFSGIQGFIFNLSSAGKGGAAKKLRARSFYVNILLEILSHYICHTFDVPLNNILISSGGKFYILLPNTANSDMLLGNIIKEMEEFLFRKSAAEISINIAVQDLSSRELEDFDRVTGKLNEKLAASKMQKFETVIKADTGWNESRFIIHDDLNNKSLCKSCGKAMVDKDTDEICERCSSDIELGQMLANAKYVYFNKDRHGMRIFKDYSINVEKELVDIKPYLAWVVNDCSFASLSQYRKPFAIKYIANHIPVFQPGRCKGCDDCKDLIQGQPIPFECLAGNSCGRSLLGIYKADVDNLGFLFRYGLKRDESQSKKNTVSRISTFSRMLDMFFSGYVNQMIHEKYQYTYCVFSGGDDLILAGPWDKMVDMSVDINNEFKRYTSHNQYFTLSAAVVPRKPGYPVSKSAEEAEEELERAKRELNRMIYTEKDEKPKNQVSFLGESIKWEDFTSFIGQGKYLEDIILKGTANINQIRRLIKYSSMYREFLTNESIEGLRFLPMMTYDISRNYSERTTEQSRFRDWVLKMRNNITSNKELYYLNIIANYALMKTR